MYVVYGFTVARVGYLFCGGGGKHLTEEHLDDMSSLNLLELNFHSIEGIAVISWLDTKIGKRYFVVGGQAFRTYSGRLDGLLRIERLGTAEKFVEKNASKLQESARGDVAKSEDNDDYIQPIDPIVIPGSNDYEADPPGNTSNPVLPTNPGYGNGGFDDPPEKVLCYSRCAASYTRGKAKCAPLKPLRQIYAVCMADAIIRNALCTSAC
jgi:hypothetical protein